MQGQLKNHLHKPKLENQFWQGKLQNKTWRPSWKVKRQLKSSTLSFKLEAGRLKTQNWTLKAAYRSLGHLTSRRKAKLEIWSPKPEASIIRLTYMHTYIYMYIYICQRLMTAWTYVSAEKRYNWPTWRRTPCINEFTLMCSRIGLSRLEMFQLLRH